MLVTEGVMNVLNSTIDTDSAGGAGVFAYNTGTANVSDTTIHTKQDTSGGIHAAGGGTLNATNLTVTTEGNSSAAIRSDRGGVFYTTNTESTFKLSNVKLQYAEKNDFFLKCTGNSNARGWGSKGSNGADCSFSAEKQEMQGNIIWDSISKLDFSMSNGSVLTGAFVQDESNAGDGGSGYANVTIDASSKWIVTGNSTVGKLICAGVIPEKECESQIKRQ